ncbi:helix-turn-helix domain-containing protein [Microbispora bryophytorum]|uniref:helix-turn-helix domain-containing protein n=1 Tax=Microbispora bryophytorum TaxID=1460882 RepID=UPI00371DD423
MATSTFAEPTSVCASPLREARLRKGLSLRDAAALARLDCGHLSRAERGQAQLSVEALYRLAVVLDLRRLRYTLAPFLPEQGRTS